MGLEPPRGGALMLLTPNKFPGIKTDLAAYFLRGIHDAPWSIVASGRERKFEAAQLDKLMLWASAQQVQQQAVGLYLDPTRFLVVTAPAEARPAERCLPPTHVILAGRLWLVWRLSAAISPADAKTATAALARQLRGGEAATGTPVPLPGTVALVRRGMQLVGKYPVQTLPPLGYSYRFVDGRLARPERAAAEPEEEIAVSADKIKARPVEWLWPDVIPLGSLTLIAGAAGMGKSQTALSIVARVTREGGNALVFEVEDDAGSVVVPRLVAAGADIKRVALGGLVDLSDGGGAIIRTAKRVFGSSAGRGQTSAATGGGVRLVVLSPIRAFYKQAEDNGNVGVRRAMEPLLKWAAAEGVTVLGIGHPPKTGRDPFAGSQAYVEVARAAYSTVYDPTDKNPHIKSRRRVLVNAKANLGPDTQILSYRIEGVTLPDGIETSRVVWA